VSCVRSQGAPWPGKLIFVFCSIVLGWKIAIRVRPGISAYFRVRCRVKEVMQEVNPFGSQRATLEHKEPSEIVFSNASLDLFLKHQLEKIKFTFKPETPQERIIELGLIDSKQSFIRLTAVRIPETETMYSLTLSVLLEGGKTELSLDDIDIKLEVYDDENPQIADENPQKAKKSETLTGKFYEVLEYGETYKFKVFEYNPLKPSTSSLNLAESSLPPSGASESEKPLKDPTRQNGVAVGTEPKAPLNGRPGNDAGAPIKDVAQR